MPRNEYVLGIPEQSWFNIEPELRGGAAMPFITITSVDGVQVSLPAKVVRNEHAWLGTWPFRNLIRLPGAFISK